MPVSCSQGSLGRRSLPTCLHSLLYGLSITGDGVRIRSSIRRFRGALFNAAFPDLYVAKKGTLFGGEGGGAECPTHPCPSTAGAPRVKRVQFRGVALKGRPTKTNILRRALLQNRPTFLARYGKFVDFPFGCLFEHPKWASTPEKDDPFVATCSHKRHCQKVPVPPRHRTVSD